MSASLAKQHPWLQSYTILSQKITIQTPGLNHQDKKKLQIQFMYELFAIPVPMSIILEKG